LDNYYQATGIGANFKVGAIARATDWLRIGFAFHTPTFYDMEDESNIEFDYNGQFADEPSIANDYYEYALQTPLKLQASLGFVIAKRALIGVEYNFENFKSMRLEMNDMVVEDEGRVIKDEMNKNSSLKIGAEVKVIDEFSLRAGFAYVGKPMQTITSDLSENIGLYIPVSVPKTSMYITGGAGYSGEHFYCDIAYIYNNQKRDLYVSMPTDKPTLDLKYANHDIMATFGWKF
jgi:long-subunit fatty acid transport protein